MLDTIYIRVGDMFEIFVVFLLVLFSRIVEMFWLKKPSFVLQLWILPYGLYFILFSAYDYMLNNNAMELFPAFYIFTIIWAIYGIVRIGRYYREAQENCAIEDRLNEIKDEFSEQNRVE